MEQQSAFDWKKPIVEEPYFYGRGIETQEILRHLGSNQSVFLIGASRIGKTSLIHHLLREDVQQLQGIIPNRHIFTHIDFNAPHYQTPNIFWTNVIDEIISILNAQQTREEQPEKQNETIGSNYEELFGFLDNSTKKHRVTIIMDGFEHLIKKDGFGFEFYNTLKQLVSQINNLSYLIVSSKEFSQLYQIDDALQNANISEMFIPIQLGLLRKQEAMSFLRQENSSLIDMERSIAEWGYVVTGGHPYLLQIIGFYLDSYSVRTKEQFMSHCDEIMSKSMNECHDFFVHLLEDLSTEEREGLLALIRFKPIGNIINLLERKSLVRDCKTQKIFSEMFDRFLRKFWGTLAESKPANIQTQFVQKVFLSGLTISFVSILIGAFALLNSSLKLGACLFGLGIFSFLFVFMFFKDESYPPQGY